MTVELWEPTGMPARIDSWVRVVSDVAQLAETIASTDFVPDPLRGNVPAITATILYGREIGLPPMQSLRSVFIVKGRPAIYAETMRGLALAAGHEIVYERQDGSTCTVRGRRDGQQSWHTVTWTLDMAKHAGLTRNPLYGTRPRAMLTARATSELCRDLFADVIAGFVAVEDLDGQPEDAVPVAETSPAPARTVGRGRAAKRVLDAPSSPDAVPGEPDPPQVDTTTPAVVDRPPASLDREGTGEPVRRARRQRATLPDDAAAGDRSLAPPPPPPAPQDDSAAGQPTLLGTLLDEEPPPLPPEDPHLPPSPDYDEPTLPIPDSEPASLEQGRAVFALLRELDYGEVSREERLNVAAALLQRPLSTFKELSRSDASRLIDTLTLLSQTTDGHAQLAAIVRKS